MKTRARVQRTLNVNPMRGVKGNVYECADKSFSWHLSLPPGEESTPALVKALGSPMRDECGGYDWWNGYGKTRRAAENGLARAAGHVYSHRLITRGYLTPEKLVPNERNGDFDF